MAQPMQNEWYVKPRLLEGGRIEWLLVSPTGITEKFPSEKGAWREATKQAQRYEGEAVLYNLEGKVLRRMEYRGMDRRRVHKLGAASE